MSSSKSSSPEASIYTLPDSGGRTISYHLSYPDEPTRPTVLLSNALCSQFHFWDPIVDRLHAANLRVLQYDHPGHGKSGVPRDLSSTTFDSLARDVYSLLAGLDLAPVITATQQHKPPATTGGVPNQPHLKGHQASLHAWIGVSMGGALGMVFATKFPGVIKKLVACDTVTCSPVNAGAPDPYGERVKAARESGSMDKTIQETMERWFGKEWIDKNPQEAGRLRSLMEQTSLDGYETCAAALRSPSFDLRPLLGRVGTAVHEAVLLLVGEKDGDLPDQMHKMKEEMEKGISEEGGKQKVGYKVIKGAGHVCFIDGKEEFLKTVLPFLIK